MRSLKKRRKSCWIMIAQQMTKRQRIKKLRRDGKHFAKAGLHTVI